MAFSRYSYNNNNNNTRDQRQPRLHRSKSQSEILSSESDISSSSGSEISPSPLLYTLLPSLLHRRIPKQLKSLKQALSSSYELSSPPPPSTRTTATTKATTQRHTRLPSVESITPPPSYRSNVDDDSDARRSFASGGSRPSTSGSATPHLILPSEAINCERDGREEEIETGVNWRYARPGMALLDLAAQEEASASSSLEPSFYVKRSNFIRRQYVDGVACLLRGLPEDLTVEEEGCLREAMGTSIRTSSPNEQGRDGRVAFRPRGGGGGGGRRKDSPTDPSTLHRFTATITLSLFLILSFLTPYIQYLLQQSYAFDRKHRISERFLAQSVVVADTLGRQVLEGARGICEWNEGKVGEIVRDVGVYCVQGVGGGVVEGFGEGVRGLGWRDVGGGGGGGVGRDDSRKGGEWDGLRRR